jgi:hypothetical protein
MKKLAQLGFFVLLSSVGFAQEFYPEELAQFDVQVDLGPGGYYYDDYYYGYPYDYGYYDNYVWGGPGWYGGYWFGTQGDFNNWHGHHHGGHGGHGGHGWHGGGGHHGGGGGHHGGGRHH